MNIRPVYLSLLAAATLAGCGGGRGGRGVVEPYAAIAAQVVAHTRPAAALAQARHALDSLAAASPVALRPAVQAICRAVVDAGRTAEALSVAALAYGIDETENPETVIRLLTSTLLPGMDAPQIMGLPPARGNPRFTLLLFHESACRTCGNIVREMKQRYGELENAGVRVVTVSADTDEKTWAEYAAGLPWPDKLCDYRGFYSQPMVVYGVPATPAIFLIDAKGTVVDQYATLGEAWEAICDGN